MANQKRVLLLCGDYVEDYEVMVPFQALLAYGVAVDAVCPGKKSGDICRTSVHQLSCHQTYTESRGHNFALNATFDEIETTKYDGLVIPGGRAPEYLAINESVLDLVKHFANAKKPIASICHGQLILAAADVVRGRKCTAFPAVKPVLLAAGAHWEEPETMATCIVDGNLITVPTYDGHPEFIRLFVKALGGGIVGSGKRILFLCGDFMEDYEVMVPFQSLQALECHVDAVCPKKKAGEKCPTAVHDFEGDQTYSEKPGHDFTLNANFDSVDASSYDGLVIPGGRAPEYLALDDDVIKLVKEFMESKKPVASICHGQQILSAAGVLKGKKCTAYPAVKALLCTGIKESSLAQAIITAINVSALVFIILAGAYLGCKTGWPGYEVSSGYFSFGVNGLLAGSATVFFSYIGFDIVASTAEEVKNPQRDMPLGIGIALSICGALYMLVSAVIVGLVPYYALDPDTPISSAFAGYGMEWAVYIIAAGAVTALCASLIGAIIPQPRILMAMARDGLLPSFFSDISKHTQVPVKGTIATGIFIAILAFFMDVSQLAGMVSVGTLLSFTVVALSILILRYVPPDELPFLPSDQQSDVSGQHLDAIGTNVAERPLLQKDIAQDKLRRRKIAAWSIIMVCFGILVVVAAISTEGLSSILCFIMSGIGGMLVICCLTVLNSIDQADTKESFMKSGGFICPFVPFLPVASILVNTYLLVNIGAQTWICVLIWLAVGVIIYIFYGRGHSLLLDDVRRPITHTDDDHADANLRLIS